MDRVVLVNGLTLGAIYGLIAIGYTMVYGIIGMINFAHGEIFMIGAFVRADPLPGARTLGGIIGTPVALVLVLLLAMALRATLRLDGRAARLPAAPGRAQARPAHLGDRPVDLPAALRPAAQGARGSRCRR